MTDLRMPVGISLESRTFPDIGVTERRLSGGFFGHTGSAGLERLAPWDKRAAAHCVRRNTSDEALQAALDAIATSPRYAAWLADCERTQASTAAYLAAQAAAKAEQPAPPAAVASVQKEPAGERVRRAYGVRTLPKVGSTVDFYGRPMTVESYGAPFTCKNPESVGLPDIAEGHVVCYVYGRIAASPAAVARIPDPVDVRSGLRRSAERAIDEAVAAASTEGAVLPAGAVVAGLMVVRHEPYEILAAGGDLVVLRDTATGCGTVTAHGCADYGGWRLAGPRAAELLGRVRTAVAALTPGGLLPEPMAHFR